MTERSTYSPGFFRSIRDDSYRSAKVVVPAVLEYVRPNSVVDVGCGLGCWLRAFQEQGIEDFLGMDSHDVPPELLEFDAERFCVCDLTQPFSVGRRFNLAVCLEVAEHLPASSADGLVRSLTQLAPVVLFSAAIPWQGGTHHVNEQWPAYWVERFRSRGWSVADCIRRRIWSNPQVGWWYAQNMLIYASAEALEENPLLREEVERTNVAQLAVVHPTHYLAVADPNRVSLKQTLAKLPGAAWRAVKRRVKHAAA
ncbi:MAG TPA: methyltransferase domain-containing protein [Terriglobales bacterium]|jgi:hypothetical protein